MTEPMVEIKNLVKVFEDGTRAVDGVNLEIMKGETFALFGPNGAGKTTMLHLMLDFIPPDKGSITIAGIDALRHPLEAKKHVGLIAESAKLYEIFSARRNLRYFADLSGKKISNKEIDKVLETVGLSHAADRAVGKFSAGMGRRLVVGVGLLKRPDLLILDEPWTALDPEGAVELSELLNQLKKKEKITMLISTHDIFQAHKVADRIGIMVKGKIRKIVEASEVKDVESLYLKTVEVAK
jgi:ABC-2 type transport system ATP-binding protein